MLRRGSGGGVRRWPPCTAATRPEGSSMAPQDSQDSLLKEASEAGRLAASSSFPLTPPTQCSCRRNHLDTSKGKRRALCSEYLMGTSVASPSRLLGAAGRSSASSVKAPRPAAARKEAKPRSDPREAWPSERYSSRCRMSFRGSGRSPLAALLLPLHSFLLLGLLPHAAAFNLGK